jgi:hypothetical protein
MLEARVKQLEKEAAEKEAAKAAMEVAEKEAAEKEAAGKEATQKEAVEKEAVKKEVAEKEVVEKEDDDEEEDQFWPSGSSNDDDPVSPIRFPRVKRWFKCPICVNYLYEHKNGLLFHIKSFIKDVMSMSDMVDKHRHLSMLLKATMHDL